MEKQVKTDSSVVADSLRNQGIPFVGPTLTPMGRRIYVVDNYPFTEYEPERSYACFAASIRK